MVRSLSKTLQKIAIEELHEDPAKIEEDIKHIQEWIMQQSHLNAPTDEQWILVFLRGCKFSFEATKKKFDRYYTLKNSIPELLKPRDICSSEIQAVLKAGFMLPLPYSKNYLGPRVVLFRFQNFNTNIMNVENTAAFLFMVLKILMIEDDNFIVSGLLALMDMEHFPLSLIFQLTPTYLKKLFEIIEKTFPLRIKKCLGIGSPAPTQILFNLVKRYMGSKLRDRIVIYTKDKFEDIFEIVPKSHLPKEYGGENSNVEAIRDYWIQKMESYSTWFDESNQYGTNEAMRPGKSASYDDVTRMDGSFRTLTID